MVGKKLKCRCGAEFVATGQHARWCPECRKLTQHEREKRFGLGRKVGGVHHLKIKVGDCPFFKSTKVPENIPQNLVPAECAQECYENVCQLTGRCRFVPRGEVARTVAGMALFRPLM